MAFEGSTIPLVSVFGPIVLDLKKLEWYSSTLETFLTWLKESMGPPWYRGYVGLLPGCGFVATAVLRKKLERPVHLLEPRENHGLRSYSDGDRFVYRRLRMDCELCTGASPEDAPVNAATWGVWAANLIQYADVLCVAMEDHGVSQQYVAQALESRKPMYLIDLDNYQADWVV